MKNLSVFTGKLDIVHCSFNKSLLRTRSQQDTVLGKDRALWRLYISGGADNT